MANRRMIAKDVFFDDRFTDLPATTRLLYIYLILSADDDGFLIGVKQALFIAGATQKDFERLIKSGYILKFESGAFVIANWLQMNRVPPDRYTPTSYTKEKSTLTLTDNKVYVFTPCKQNVNAMITQDSIVKDSIVKGNIEKGNIAQDDIQTTSIITEGAEKEKQQKVRPAENAGQAAQNGNIKSPDDWTEEQINAEALKITPGNFNRHYKRAGKLEMQTVMTLCDRRRDMIRKKRDPADVDREIQKAIDKAAQNS